MAVTFDIAAGNAGRGTNLTAALNHAADATIFIGVTYMGTVGPSAAPTVGGVSSTLITGTQVSQSTNMTTEIYVITRASAANETVSVSFTAATIFAFSACSYLGASETVETINTNSGSGASAQTATVALSAGSAGRYAFSYSGFKDSATGAGSIAAAVANGETQRDIQQYAGTASRTAHTGYAEDINSASARNNQTTGTKAGRTLQWAISGFGIVTASTPVSTSKAAYTNGAIAATTSISAYMPAGSFITVSKSAYILGYVFERISIPAFTKGAAIATTSKAAYMPAGSVIIANKSVYTKGSAGVISNKSAYTSGKISLVDNKSAFTKGSVSSSDNQNAFTSGLNIILSNITAFVKGSINIISNINSYTKGSTGSISNKSAYTSGSFFVNDSQSVYTNGFSSGGDATTSTHAFTIGIDNILSPDGDVSRNGIWENELKQTTNLYQSIDEVIADDNDYIWDIDPIDGDYIEFSLSNPPGTPGDGDVIVFWRGRDKSGLMLGATVQLLQGTTVIAQQAFSILLSNAVNHYFQLTPVEKANITDWTDLRIRIYPVSL